MDEQALIDAGFELVEDDAEYLETYEAECDECGSSDFHIIGARRNPQAWGRRVETTLYRAACAGCGVAYRVFQDGEEIAMERSR